MARLRGYKFISDIFSGADAVCDDGGNVFYFTLRWGGVKGVKLVVICDLLKVRPMTSTRIDSCFVFYSQRFFQGTLIYFPRYSI